MGAEEILKILTKLGPLTCLEISERTDCSKQSVNNAIKRLLKDVSEELDFRVLTTDEKVEKYGHKLSREVRIFWIRS